MKSVARSFSGCAGSAAARASAADAPQIAVAPPLSSPNSDWNPISRASSIETPIVSTTETMTIPTGPQPSAVIWPAVMRSPSSATPKRSTWRAANSIPGAHGPSPERKFIAMPSSSANSITGAP